ncbi:MAG: Na(+)/H(+) antiporter subunit B [Pseudomonadota bacterium]
MRLDLILRVTAKVVIPFMIVFAFYVHFHGEFGPGGGFQAGVIITGTLALYTIVFGSYAARKAFPPALAHAMAPAGVLIYASAGLPALFLGKEFLNLNVFAGAQDLSQLIGIIWVEVGVIVTVAGAMISIFYALVDRGRP